MFPMVINSPKNDLWYRFSQDKLALMGLGIFGLIILAILLGPLLYQTPMDKIDFSQSTISPSLSHPLGTNNLGQDQLVRANV